MNPFKSNFKQMKGLSTVQHSEKTKKGNTQQFHSDHGNYYIHINDT